MTDNFNLSLPVNWPKFARKQIFIPKRLDSMFGRALIPGWRPFVNKVYALHDRFGEQQARRKTSVIHDSEKLPKHSE